MTVRRYPRSAANAIGSARILLKRVKDTPKAHPSSPSVRLRSRFMFSARMPARARSKKLANMTRMSRTIIHICVRSEEHTSELQSLMRISYAVFCLKKKNKKYKYKQNKTKTYKI